MIENFEIWLTHCVTKLQTIDQAIAEEMSQPHEQRRSQLLQFLYHEKGAYSSALRELGLATVDQGGSNGQDKSQESGLSTRLETKEREGNNSVNNPTHHIITCGGIGDVLLTTPTFRALKKQQPNCKIYVYCSVKSHQEALKHNPFIDRLTFLTKRAKFFYSLLTRYNLITMHIAPYWKVMPSFFYNKNASEIIGEMLGVKVEYSPPDCFITEAEETEARNITSKYPNPIAIHTSAKSSSNKNWPNEYWEKLVQNNSEYSFLQLGRANEELVPGAVDLRGQTSLRQSFGIIKTAMAFIGVDSVLAHAATAFRTPAVVLFGPSKSSVWGHPMNHNLYNAPRCSPCIDILGREPCPYGKECMFNLTVSHVEQALRRIIV